MNIYLVGGAVRDALLDLPVHEQDWVVVGASAEQLLAQGYLQVGKDFPVFLHPQTHEEYALARTERKSGYGYTGFSCYASPDVTLEQDLLRRDLTINAIAQDTNKHLIDPFNGQQDIKNRILRHVSPAFSEDPLRVLRVARFAARFAHLGFSIASETMQLMQQISQCGELERLTPERVWKETEKALATDDPQVYFQVLYDCGALAILFPELHNLFGVPAPEKWHPEIDTGIHTLLVLKQVARLTKELDTRFATLCHDVGKGLTPKSKWPHHYGHAQTGVPLVKQICQRFRLPNSTTELAILVCQYHDLLHTVTQLKPLTLLNLFNALDLWRKPQRLDALIIASTADIRGRTGWEDRDYPQADYFRQAFAVAQRVSTQAIIDDNFIGAAISEELQKRRLTALTEWKKTNEYHAQ